MGLLSRFQPKPAAPAPDAGPAARAWRKTDFLAVSAGDDLHLVCTRGGTPFTVPSFAIDFVFGCRQFLPLEEHIAEHAEKHRWGALQHEALRSWLPRMMDAGLLISSQQLLERCAGMSTAGEPPPAISAIGFPTGGNRIAVLGRALESFAANLREHGRTADLLVSDGSVKGEHQSAFRAQAAALAGSTGVSILYAGEEEKRRYLGEIVRRSGCDPAAVEFALFDPLGTGFSCGANRNAIVLHSAGRMGCSVDDDVICRIAVAPASRAKLSLFSSCDPFTRRLFPDFESALAAANFEAQDFLAAHEAMLGHGLGTFCGESLDEASFDIEEAGDDLLRRLEAGPTQVRATFAGHVGDPGIPTSIYYLYYSGENRLRLPHDETEYRTLFANRSVHAGVANSAVGDASVSPGMAMGLDTRELLPPFFPVLHAEDYVFGATLWQCCPRTLLGHLPASIVHDPGPGKSILQLGGLGGERRMVIPEFAHLIRRVILHYDLADHADTTVRTMALGRFLSGLAARPARDFQQYLRESILGHESEKIEWLSGQLREDEGASEWWRRDVEFYLDHTREALAHPDFDLPYDLKGARPADETRKLIQRLFREFGRLLEQWPAIFAAAQEINQRGEEPLFGGGK
jgi:hypothetical protein